MEIIKTAPLMDWIPIILGLMLSPLGMLLTLQLKAKLPEPRDTRLIEGLFLFLIYFLLLAIPSILLSFSDESPSDQKQEEEAVVESEAETIPLEELLLQKVLMLGTLSMGALLYLALRKGKEGLAATGFGIRKPVITLSFSLSAYISFIPIYFLFCHVSRLFIPFEHQKIVQEMLNNPESRGNPLVILCIALFIPILEEVLFRGLLLSGLKAFMPRWGAVFTSAVLFALVHEPSSVLPVFSLGLILGYLKVRTGSLFSCMLVHGSHNFLIWLIIPYVLR